MRPAIRLTLLLVFLAAMASTASLFWMAERGVQQIETAARTFDEHARETTLRAGELGAAQQAYVASGQGIDFWFARTNALQNELKGRVSALRTAATASSDAVSAFETALGSLQDFEQMDVRARERVRAKQTLVASDLIFSDGVDLTRKIGRAIDQGRVAANASFDADAALLQRRAIFSFGAAIAAATLIVILLAPVQKQEIAIPQPRVELPRARPASSSIAPPVEPIDDVPEAPTVVIKPVPVQVVEEPVAPPVTPPPVAPPALVLPAPVPAEPLIDLPEVARLCADMARLVDTRALPGMLERAASLLDASGMVLWIADPDGRELAPIVTHGYAPQLVTRLGTIPRAAENATAAAFRTCLLQTVDTDAVSSGAIAAPLVTPAGCVGVMAAEIRHEGERQEAVLAAAGILAAQFATLVGPPSSRIKADAVG
jgi:hypothetical protein